MASVIDAGQKVDSSKSFQVARALLCLATFLHCERQPSPKQKTEDHASCQDIENLRDNQQDRHAHHNRKLGREDLVNAAKVEAEVDVLENVSQCIDAKYGQQQPGRAECVRIADVKEDDCAQHRQPQRDDYPVDQCRSKTHDRRCSKGPPKTGLRQTH